ncbi:uncharacterized protein PgNI_01150 [Pyricularia grisea]|uniref:Cellobiose dehydrogenase-like cytochrome domain-containing protein n=1 Tax=Pyricularia grisea TaxID=148305 RepID=A0A6P8BIU8_PYRGI|nr:uncharacterized protein PgNI_01150 [Pyricularia grisea]TLD16635.1 hypothetical protein PgNI_01150 [Pyricularia grisea]
MRFGKAITRSAFTAAYAVAQYEEMIPNSFTDEEIGIEFASWSVFTAASRIEKFPMVMTLPADALEREATEYVGYLLTLHQSQPRRNRLLRFRRTQGHTTTDLLVTAWPHKGQVLTSFRYTTGYHMPSPDSDGSATLMQIRVARAGGEDESVNTSSPDHCAIFGCAQSSAGPESLACPARLTFALYGSGFVQ